MIRRSAERYRRNLVESVIPFWLEHAIDDEHGGVFTCLDRDGSIYDDRKYVWLQGRAMWTFATLYNELSPDPRYLEIAVRTREFLARHAFDAKGRMFFSLTRDGKPVFFQRKIYAAAFYIQGLAELHRATGDRALLDEAMALFERVLEWKADPSLLGRPTLAGMEARSSLAEVMVTALLALELADHMDPARLGAIFDAAVEGAKRHFDPALGVLMENAPIARARPEDRMFNPGHSIETAWFLLKVLDRRPDAEAEAMAYRAIEDSLRLGWDAKYGGLFYFMDVEGRPTLQLESTMKLWWPHAEAIYACVLAYSRTRDTKWLEWLRKVEDYAFAHFADEELGEWFGYCERGGELAHAAKGGNYKGFYHVPRALLFSLKEIERNGL